jgi:hypothetical protein
MDRASQVGSEEVRSPLRLTSTTLNCRLSTINGRVFPVHWLSPSAIGDRVAIDYQLSTVD